MKAAVKIFVGLLFVFVVTIFAVPFVIPVETYKAELVKQVREATGRDLQINGAIRATLFPNAGLYLEGVTLSNMKGGKSKYMFEVGSLTAEVGVSELLSGQVKVERFILERPLVNLEVDKDGKANWQFTPIEKEVSQDEAPKKNIQGTKRKMDADSLQRLQIGSLEIRSGVLNFANYETGAEDIIKDVNAVLTMPTLSSRATLKGNGNWRDEDISINARLDNMAQFLGGESTALAIKADADSFDMSFDGKVKEQEFDGNVTFVTPSLYALIRKVGAAGVGEGAPTPLSVNLSGKLECASQQCQLLQGIVAVDENKMSVNAEVSFKSEKPQLRLSINSNQLDVTPYMQKAELQGGAQIPSLVPPALAQSVQAGWSREPMDFSWMKNFDGWASYEIGRLTADKVVLNGLSGESTLQQGVLKNLIRQVSLYGGSASGWFSVDASKPVPQVAKDFSFENIDANAYLLDMFAFDRLRGVASGKVKVYSQGKSVYDIVSNVNGSGQLLLKNGAVRGVNLAQMIRDVKATLTQTERSGVQETDFTELGGDFVVKDGVVSNDNLSLKAPLLRVTGGGKVMLPSQQVDYRLVPEIISSLQGQGGGDKKGIAVPVNVKGTFDHLTFTPDLAAGITEVLKDPEAAKQTIKDIKQELKDNKSLIKDIKSSVKENPGNAVNNLLQGLTGKAPLPVETVKPPQPSNEVPVTETPVEATPEVQEAPAAPAPVEQPGEAATESESPPVN